MFECFPSCEWQDFVSAFKNCENTTCLDDFDKSKPEIRPALYVTMVVSSIYCNKIVHTKIHLLSTTCQTCINAYSYASLKSNKALINRVEGTETVKFKMLKGTIFVGYQNRKFLLCAELPNSSNLRFSQNCYPCKLMTLIKLYIDVQSSLLFLPSNSINLIRINADILIRLHRCTGPLEPSLFAYATRHLMSCPI